MAPTPVLLPGESHGGRSLVGYSPWGRKESDTTESVALSLSLTGARVSLVAQTVKNPPAMRETWVRSLSREDPLEKRKATHSSILAWRIPWTIWGCKESDTTERLSLQLVSAVLDTVLMGDVEN